MDLKSSIYEPQSDKDGKIDYEFLQMYIYVTKHFVQILIVIPSSCLFALVATLA